MSNNPMKKPIEKRRMRKLTTSHINEYGVAIALPMKKGDFNWRARCGQRADKLGDN